MDIRWQCPITNIHSLIVTIMAKTFEKLTVNTFSVKEGDIIAFWNDAESVVTTTTRNGKLFAIECIAMRLNGTNWEPIHISLDSFRRSSAISVEVNGKKTFAPQIDHEVTKAFLQARTGEDLSKFFDKYPTVSVEKIYRVKCTKKDGALYDWSLIGLGAADQNTPKWSKAQIQDLRKEAEERQTLSDQYFASLK